MLFEIFKGSNGQFYWRFVASNGKNICWSGEGYYNKADCQHGIQLVKTYGPTAPVKDLTVPSGRGAYGL